MDEVLAAIRAVIESDQPISSQVSPSLPVESDSRSSGTNHDSEVPKDPPRELLRVRRSQLATLLGLSVPEAQNLIDQRSRQGGWQIDASTPDPTIGLSSHDLNAAINARYDRSEEAHLRPDSAADDSFAEQSELHRLREELLESKKKIFEMSTVLRQALDALEAFRRSAPNDDELRRRLIAEQQISSETKLALQDAKEGLIAAYDKILNLQEAVYQSREQARSAELYSDAIQSISDIVSRLKHHSPSYPG
jgi:hypothetical protein